MSSTGCGVAIPVGDPVAAGSAVRALLASGPLTPAAHAGDAYAYPALAARYEETIEQTIRRRGGAD